MGQWASRSESWGPSWDPPRNKKIIKVVEHQLSYKKVSGHTCPSSPGMELGDSKDWYVSNIILYWNGKVNSLSGWTLSKLLVISKNYSNKSFWELNFVQKSQWAHTSISPKSEARSKDWYTLCIILYTETRKLTQFRGRRCKNSWLFQKMV